MKTITADMHTHLLEKGEKPEKYWQAVKEKKLDAVAITEHFDCRPEKAYSMLLEKKPAGTVLIPGIELRTSIGHVLAYGRDEGIYSAEGLIEKNLDIKKAIEIAKENSILLSIAHPWGLSYDSAAYLMGEKGLRALVERQEIGIEAYNGLFGHLGSVFYGSNWIRKPMNFFDFLEKSRIGRKTRLDRLGRRAKDKLDKKGREIIERCAKPLELAEKAAFVTAGSDAHSRERIGLGVMEMNIEGKPSPEKVLETVRQRKNVIWVGPYVKKTKKGFYSLEKPKVNKKEIFSGIKYATKRAIVKKVGSKGKG